MGKKGAKRKTRWRVLPIGAEEGGSGSGNDDDDLGTYSRATQKPRPPGRTHAGTGGGNGYYNNKQHYHPRSYPSHEHSQPLVTTEKQIFNEEEYTKITTPRQDVLFKKGYLGRKRPVVVAAAPGPEDAAEDAATDRAEDLGDVDGNDCMEEQPQYIYTNGFVDQTGVYYINGSGYEMYDPYTGQVAVLVGPHYGHPGAAPALLAAVSCQPVPLQPLEWFNPPGFLPYAQAPFHGPGMPGRDRRKRYSTDSQNCSPVSSESTGPPGSPQESDETGRGGADLGAPAGAPPPLPMAFPHPPPTYVYPGYMFGAPMYNCNGVTVQTTPNQAPCSDVAGKRRKKKRKRRRKVAGEGDASEESSSEGGADDKEEPGHRRDSPSQESSLESDSKHSASSEDRYAEPAVTTALNPRAVDFTCTARNQQDATPPPDSHAGTTSNGLNVHVSEFEAKSVDNEVDYSKTNGLSVGCIDFEVKSVENEVNYSKTNGLCVNSIDFEAKPVDNEVDYFKTNGLSVDCIDFEAKSVANEVDYSKTNGTCVNSIEIEAKSVLHDRYSSINNQFGRQRESESSGSNEHEAKVANHVLVSSRPKLDFAAVVSTKVNGHATPASPPEEPIADVDVFERYEDFAELNGFAHGAAEEEWITVKPKTRKSDSVGHSGQPEKKDATNGHAKPYKDNRQTNGRGYRQETRLYKSDVKYNGNARADDKQSPKSKPHDGYAKDSKPSAKVRVNGKMEGNEKVAKERKTSSSSSEGKAEAAPMKPSRRERKNKSVSPPKTPDATPATAERTTCRSRPLSVVDGAVQETRQISVNAPPPSEQEVLPVPTVAVPEDSPSAIANPPRRTEEHDFEARADATSVTATLPKVASLKDLSAKSIVHEAPAIAARAGVQTALPDQSNADVSPDAASAQVAKDATASFLAAESAGEDAATSAPQVDVVEVATEPSRDAVPVAPPRRKKYRPPSQRLAERAATPGKGSDSDTSTSTASEASVIECLASALDPSDQSGLSSSDEEVIYAGQLGVQQPTLVGRMRVPRSTWTPSSRKTEASTIELAVAATTPSAEDAPLDAAEVTRLAAEIVDSVIEQAVNETARLKRPNLGITDAVTRWLRSQSPDVLSVSGRSDEMADIREETEDELDDEDGSKNWQRDPLAAPSVDVDGADKRVANKIAEKIANDVDGRNVMDGCGDAAHRALGALLSRTPEDETRAKEEFAATATTGSGLVDDDDAARFFQEAGELEWDSWDLTALTTDAGVESRYDPSANDTFQAVDRVETPTSPAVCPTLYDAGVSVAKYYTLAERSTSPSRESSDSDADDALLGGGGVATDRYRVSLATELARLQQPLPPTWHVAPLVVKATPFGDAADSGVESGEEAVAKSAKKPSVFRRKLIGRLKGEGGPFPVGGVCCIVQ